MTSPETSPNQFAGQHPAFELPPEDTEKPTQVTEAPAGAVITGVSEHEALQHASEPVVTTVESALTPHAEHHGVTEAAEQNNHWTARLKRIGGKVLDVAAWVVYGDVAKPSWTVKKTTHANFSVPASGLAPENSAPVAPPAPARRTRISPHTEPHKLGLIH